MDSLPTLKLMSYVAATRRDLHQPIAYTYLCSQYDLK